MQFSTGGKAHEPKGMTWCNSKADSIVWIKEDHFIFLLEFVLKLDRRILLWNLYSRVFYSFLLPSMREKFANRAFYHSIEKWIHRI